MGMSAIPRRPTQLGSMVQLGSNAQNDFTSDEAASPEEISVEVPRGTAIRQSTQQQLYLSVSFLPAPTRRLIVFDPPRQRQRWGDNQVLPHVNWGDLYFDLFYVAAAYNLSYVLIAETTTTSYEGLLYFIGLFGPILVDWFTVTFFDARFSTAPDPWHGILDVVRYCFLATAVVHIRPPYEMRLPYTFVDMFGYSLGCTCLTVMNIYKSSELVVKGIGDKQALKHAGRSDIMGFSFQFVFYLAATCVSGIAYFGNTEEHADVANVDSLDDKVTHLPIILMIAGWGSDVMFFMLNMMQANKTDEEFANCSIVPLNVGYCIHRTGELVMILLGESILSLLIVETSTNIEYYICMYAGIVSCTLLMYLYYKYQPHHPEDHALCGNWAAMAWYYFFILIFCFALIGIGTSYKM